MNVTELTRKDILDHFITSKITFSGKLDELEFLGRIWNLYDMPSWDGRFDTAYADIRQHRINNYDWEDHYLLCTRLDLLKCEDETFAKFLENCVHPLVQPNKKQASQLVSDINTCLRHETNLRHSLHILLLIVATKSITDSR